MKVNLTIEENWIEDRHGRRAMTLEEYDAAAIRLTGNVQGSPPYTGALRHRGWRAKSLRLPQTLKEHDPAVLAPAEVEL